MFNIATIQAAFLARITWSNSQNSDIPKLAVDLTAASSSGLVYNNDRGAGVHPLVTLDNLDAAAPDFDAYPASNWSAQTTYAAGDMCRRSSQTYVSKAGTNLNHDPATDTANTYWETAFSAFIRNMVGSSVVKMLKMIETRKVLQQSTKNLLDNWKIFDGDGRITDYVINQGRFVGFEISLRGYTGLQVLINQIGIQFTQSQKDLNIYLFHTSLSEPLKIWKVSSDTGGSFKWNSAANEELNFTSYLKNTDAGGRFYIGYFEDDITGQAINRNIDFVAEPCGNCFKDEYNRLTRRRLYKLAGIRPVTVDREYFSETEGNKPDMDHLAYENQNNFGLNLAITVRCDLTEFYTENIAAFDNALHLQFAIEALNLIAFSNRTDGLAENVRQDAVLELKEGQLMKRYDEALKAIIIDTSDLSSPCLAPANNRGITISSVQ